MESKQFYDEMARKRKEIESLNIPEPEKQRLYDAVDISIKRYEDTPKKDDFGKLQEGLAEYNSIMFNIVRGQEKVLRAHEKSVSSIEEIAGYTSLLGKTSDNLTASVKESASSMEKILKEKIPGLGKSMKDLGAAAITSSNRKIQN